MGCTSMNHARGQTSVCLFSEDSGFLWERGVEAKKEEVEEKERWCVYTVR